MRFWDTSALVPLLVEESSSAAMRELIRRDRTIVAGILTPLEIESALWRRRHANQLDAEQHSAAEAAFADISGSWKEVSQVRRLMVISSRLMARCSVKTLDALQLASALVASGFRPALLPFVTLDRDLAAIARAEGFHVPP